MSRLKKVAIPQKRQPADIVDEEKYFLALNQLSENNFSDYLSLGAKNSININFYIAAPFLKLSQLP